VGRAPDAGGRGLLAAVAADGATIAFATTTHEQGLRGLTSVDVLSDDWQPDQVATGVGTPRSLAVDAHRVAILWPDGTVDVRGLQGRRIPTIGAAGVRALALEGSTLVLLRGNRLLVVDVRTGLRTRAVAVPAGATGLDLQYGVAALAAGRHAVVVDTASGRTAVVGKAPHALVGVQIEGPGLAYGWTGARSGVVRFVPTIELDRALGLAA